MAFVTGTANSLPDVLSALIAICTANGWSHSGDVLHKGGCYAQLQVVGESLVLRGGTGIDGENALIGPGTNVVRLGTINAGPFKITFPVTYEIHVHSVPDEVYCLVNHDSSRWQYLMFGLSDVDGVPGSGMFYAASLPSISSGWDHLIAIGTDYGGRAFQVCPAPFWTDQLDSQIHNSFIHHGFLGGTGWSGGGGGQGSATSMVLGEISASKPLVPRYARQPNAYNGAASLLDFKVWLRREDNKVSLIQDFAHARLIRVDNYNAGEIIDLAPDRWRVYPWHQKDTSARDGGNTSTGITHTGTLGWAIRYDGA